MYESGLKWLQLPLKLGGATPGPNVYYLLQQYNVVTPLPPGQDQGPFAQGVAQMEIPRELTAGSVLQGRTQSLL